MAKKIILIIIGILAIDQIVKILVKTQMAPYEDIPVIDGFFQIYYIENQGMAFGTKLGAGVAAKYALSIFRLLAVTGIAIYIRRLMKDPKATFVMVLSIALIFAGATGNLLDSMFYDYIWEVDPDVQWNWVRSSDGNFELATNELGNVIPKTRNSGFLLASVVDMCQFTVKWPSWMPWGLGGTEIFSAIWNIADASITFGVILIIIKYRKFFKKDKNSDQTDSENTTEEKIAENDSNESTETASQPA